MLIERVARMNKGSLDAGQKKGPGSLREPPGPHNRTLRGPLIPERGHETNVCRVAPFLFLQYIASPVRGSLRSRDYRPKAVAPARLSSRTTAVPPVPAGGA
jgi:hypothetical protein